MLIRLSFVMSISRKKLLRNQSKSWLKLGLKALVGPLSKSTFLIYTMTNPYTMKALLICSKETVSTFINRIYNNNLIYSYYHFIQLFTLSTY